MSTYTPFDGTVLVPVQVVQLKFTEKEDISLNPFQNLILEAIEDGCGVEQIAEATLLDAYVIETEIAQLVTQKLLERQGDCIALSELSQKLLLVSRCVQRLNQEQALVCINLVTGAVEAYDRERLVQKGGSDALELRPKVRKQELDGISIEENIVFFQTYLHTFDTMEPEQVDAVLSSVYVEFIHVGERSFRVQSVSRLPCLISDRDSRDADGQAPAVPFWTQGYLCRAVFSVKSALPEVGDDLLTRLPTLAGAGLLSEKGMRLADAVDACEKRGAMTAYYDYTSKALQFGDPPVDGGAHRVDLELPPPHGPAPDDLERFAAEARSYFDLPPELALTVTCSDSAYIVCGDLEKLWEAGHD